MKYKVPFVVASLFLCLSTVVAAQEEDNVPRWIRHSCISPDGGEVAFSWQGDIYKVASAGGRALQLTSHRAYDGNPMWSADGGRIVFTSDRDGSQDIWSVSSEGGDIRKLTTFSGNENLIAVSADGYLYFSANIQQNPQYCGFPGMAQLYRMPLEGGDPVQVLPFPVMAASVSTDGNTILYEDYKGVEDNFRKHHTSSVTRDIWSYEVNTSSFRKLTSFKGENRNPVWCGTSGDFFYLSEQGGNFNLWMSNVNSPQECVQITDLPVHPVRFMSASEGGTVVFSYNGDLYTCTRDSAPRKIAITLVKDKMEKDVERHTVLGGVKAMAFSPDEKELAVVSHGDVFVTLSEQGLTHRITSTPQQERGVSFSEDGRTLYYASERNGFWGIYKCCLADKKAKYFSLSYSYEESLFTTAGETCFQPSVSPDGKWLAFLRDRSELVIKNTSSGEERSLLKDVNYSYSDGDQEFEWSPDSRWLLATYCAGGGWQNPDIALVSIDGKTVVNLTESGYSDRNFKWVLGGKAMTWESDRAGYRSHGSWGSEKDVYIMFFDEKEYSDFRRGKDDRNLLDFINGKKSKDKKNSASDTSEVSKHRTKVKPLEFELDSRFDRVVRLTPNSGRLSDHILSKDGTKIFYSVLLEKSYDLVCRNLLDGSISVAQRGVKGRFVPSREGKCFYVPGRLSISKIDASTGKNSGSVSFRGEYEYNAAEERAYIFEHCWKQVKDRFYDENIHGVDWKGFHDNYVRFLPYIDNNYDFCELLSELLGELNASHTGARYRSLSGLFFTPAGRLGVLYDTDFRGKGLKIAEILPLSALKRAMPELEAGDVIVSVNGREIGAGEMWYDALAMTAGKRTELMVRHDGKDIRVFIKPPSSDGEGPYLRWVRNNEKIVEKLSAGKVGYVHVKAMDSDSFREVFSKSLGKYRNCDALIVDTRHNHGGWLHEDLAVFLSGKEYIESRPRGRHIATEPFFRWCKPSCVVMGEDNYSDGCGFPYLYRTMGIGPLIGAPVPGTKTSVWWETQVDNTIVFGIPQVTSWGLNEERALENLELQPDILVYNTPSAEIEGRDTQLEVAVKTMLEAIAGK